ncbi:CLUMA_CG017308, isoform A [Clunio marinus]|uniref:CLUMA_CG017308, isoform A n=1 Tax=Clunio marinus TaxID=568069 RepID=A0A1J1IVS6_9DIPT|nr:CLUMA_CG017308, isoform A [Clunio marinus]
MSSNGRPLMKILLENFLKSFRIRQIKGNFIGEDYFGNKFYEIPKDPSKGKSKTSRWFEPPEKENHEQEISAEWESWLRGRRKEPPTQQELMKNLAIMQLKKKNADLLDQKFPPKQDQVALRKDETGRQKASFPSYDDYEVMPGKPKVPSK